MIDTRTVWRELRDFLLFEDIGIVGIFEGDRSRGGGDCRDSDMFEIQIGIGIGIKINRGGNSFLETCYINDCESK